MRLFSIPSDFRTSTVDRYCELNSRYDNAQIEETYGQATVGVPYGSGRGKSVLPPVSLDDLARYIAFSSERGIGFNYTFNASCLGNSEFTEAGFRQANRFLSRLNDIGVRTVTISLPQLITLARDSGHNFTIKVSTICQVNSPHRAAYHSSQGISRMVVDEDTVRDFRRIRQICDVFGDGVEVIVNSACMRHCPFRQFHYNHESHFDPQRQDVKNYYGWICTMRKVSDWTSAVKLCFVRPEDLGLYESVGVRHFKLQGRHQVIQGDPARAAEAYMKGSYSGNLYSLLNLFHPVDEKTGQHPYVENSRLDGFLQPFYDNPDHCTGNCAKCRYCERFAEAAMNREQTEAGLNEMKERLVAVEPFDLLRNGAVPPSLTRRLIRRLTGKTKVTG